MPTVTVHGLDLDQSECLLLAWSSSCGCWIASIGNLDADDQRELERGETAAEALGMLFMRLGAGKIEGTA